jgi:hypothetical protein
MQVASCEVGKAIGFMCTSGHRVVLRNTTLSSWLKLGGFYKLRGDDDVESTTVEVDLTVDLTWA